MLRKKLKNLQKDESGQSLVELAVILPILILLLTLPVDFFRYVNTKMILNSATSESIGQLDYDNASKGTATADALANMKMDLQGRLDDIDNLVPVIDHCKITDGTGEYNYRVYSSEKANQHPDDYDEQFLKYDHTKYPVKTIQLQYSYKFKPMTFWGVLFFPNDINVITAVYNRSVYGYTDLPKP